MAQPPVEIAQKKTVEIQGSNGPSLNAEQCWVVSPIVFWHLKNGLKTS
jgi:hypothetical protein